MREIPCRACKGARLRPETLAVKVGGIGIHEFARRSAREAIEWLGGSDAEGGGPDGIVIAPGFTDLHARDVRNPFAVELVGLDNYTKLLDDDTFRQIGTDRPGTLMLSQMAWTASPPGRASPAGFGDRTPSRYSHCLATVLVVSPVASRCAIFR